MENRKVEILSIITLEELVNGIVSSVGEEELLEIVKGINENTSSENFTKKCYDYFKERVDDNSYAMKYTQNGG